MAEKVAMLVESNERMLDPLVNVYGEKALFIHTNPHRIWKSIDLITIISSTIYQASKMTSVDLGLVRETREIEGRAQATKAAPLDQVFPIKPMAEDGDVAVAGEVEAKAVDEVGAIKKVDEVSSQHSQFKPRYTLNPFINLR